MNKDEAPVLVEIMFEAAEGKIHTTTAWGQVATWRIEDHMVIVDVTGDESFTKVIHREALISLEITRRTPPAQEPAP